MKSNSISQRLGDIFGPRLLSLLVLCHGIFIVVFTLVEQFNFRRAHVGLDYLSVDITLGVGLTAIYLSSLLGRRKRSAFIATAIAYSFYLGSNIEGLTDLLPVHHIRAVVIILRALVLPGIVLLLLFINRRKFVVRSDSQGFRAAIIMSLILLAVTFVYGTLGFYTLGSAGFHYHMSVPTAMHYTVDQLNLTTNFPIHAYTKKAQLFVDSLSFATIFAILYVLVAFVQPLRARFGDQRTARARFEQLLNAQHDAISEDFFKLWPPDKQYFFDSSGQSGLAFHVYRGAALVLGGPAGKQARFKQLMSEFQYVCWGNDWHPAIIHADESLLDIYSELGFSAQKIGEEAIVDLHTFNFETVNDKYFRNISSRFAKQDYSFELIRPPHHEAVLNRLKEISDEWMARGNHVERGFAMGYFNHNYIAMCDIGVARDAAGTIQAFINLVPAPFDKEEGDYDLMRSSSHALGNVNDYLLINVCKDLLEAGYKRMNLGLCPLVGLEGEDKKGLVGSFLSFAYANGDRFYSFSGLYRFKNKYAPNWRSRYVIYRGGVRGFSKTMNALMRTMSVTAKHHLGIRSS